MLNIMNKEPWNKMLPETKKGQDCSIQNKQWKSDLKITMKRESLIFN